MRTFVYPARFRREAKPGVLVIAFRDVPEAITQGNGERVSLWQAADCLEEAIAGRIADGLEIPKASRAARGERLIPVPAPMAAKVALYLAMREAGVTNVHWARRLGCDEKDVRRMLDPRRPTKVHLARGLGCDEKEVRRMLDPRRPTKLPRIKEALDVFGKRLVVSVEEAA